MQYYHAYQELQRIRREQEQNVAQLPELSGTLAQNIDLAFICNVECLWPFYL